METKFVNFKVRCPVSGCTDTSSKQWVHADCNRLMEINS